MRYHVRGFDNSGKTVRDITRNPMVGAEVTAVSSTPNEWGEHPGAELSMSSAIEEPNFSTNYGHYDVSDEYEDISGRDDDPTELFTHVPPQIRGAYSDPRIRHALPTMVGLAMNHLGSHADVPMADYSLTPFSAALSRNAVERGLAVPHYWNREMETDGTIDDDSGEWVNDKPDVSSMRRRTVGSPDLEPEYYGDAASSRQVSDARSWVKSRLQATKAVRGESQFKDVPHSQAHQDWQAEGIKPGPGQERLF